MKRRNLLVALGGGALMPWALPALAQRGTQPVIGVLVLGNPDPGFFLEAFREQMEKLGYVDGQNCRYEVRSAKGDAAQLSNAAAELVRLPVNLLVTWLTPAALAARNATKTIPIVMASAGDPIATGLVESLSRPGGNVTGTSGVAAEVASKNVELLREIIPNLARVGVLFNSADPFANPFIAAIENTTNKLGVGLEKFAATPAADLEPLLKGLRDKKIEAVLIQPTLLRAGVPDLLLKYRLPSASVANQFPRDGGLMSYNANSPSLWKQSATYVDRILKGENPANLPVAQPTKFDFIINLKTARLLGISLSGTLIGRADEVIE